MKRLLLLCIALGCIILSCDRDNFAEMNQDPSKLTNPDLVYLFTKSLQGMEQSPYTQWFYDNVQYILPWTQVTVGAGGSAIPQGNDSQLNSFGAVGNRMGKFYQEVLPALFEIRHQIENEYSGEEQVSYQKLKAITYPIQVYYGLRVTDLYGSLAYSEAMQARYTNPPVLTPVYDSQEELFNLWLEELNGALEVLRSTPQFEGETVSQVSPGNQDFVYNGNWNQWAKFINSLKLRIAVRLLHQNQSQAISIVENVVSSQFGPITEMEDNFMWTADIDYYGPSNPGVANNIESGHGARKLINFLRTNQDPRLRFLFNKNDFNSMVIQGFYEAGKAEDIPEYIQQYIISDVVNGNRVFQGWKAPGEPWVRYFGAPAAPDSALSGTVSEEYFRTSNWRLGNKNYEPKSQYKMEMFGTSMDYTYPDVPGSSAQNDQDFPFHRVLYSAAETNLYLAEFKLLGANLPQSAQGYLQKAVRQSVETYDNLAELNGIVYYNETYDQTYGATVALKSGEIQDLLTQPAYTLTASSQAEKLEKVYIQQFIHFMGMPTQLYVTARRSGIPMDNSQYLERVPFWDGGVEMIIPRRFFVTQPSKDNINYQNIVDAINAQGFTPGDDSPQVLHDERLWYDEGAPDWGEGPSY